MDLERDAGEARYDVANGEIFTCEVKCSNNNAAVVLLMFIYTLPSIVKRLAVAIIVKVKENFKNPLLSTFSRHSLLLGFPGTASPVSTGPSESLVR